MKKKLLFAFALFFAVCTVQAQSVSTGSTNISSAGSFVITNFTPDYWGSTSTSYLQAKLKVKNLSSGTKTVGLTKIILDTITGTLNSFCWGISCWSDTIYIAPNPSVIPAGVSDSTFRGDYVPFGKVGTTHVRYLFYDKGNTSDSISVVIAYHITPVGIQSSSISESHLAASPNPANGMTTIAYTLGAEAQNGKILIHNLLGSVMEEIPLTDKQSSITLMTDNYPAGIYFYSLLVDNRAISTKKLVIAH